VSRTQFDDDIYAVPTRRSSDLAGQSVTLTLNDEVDCSRGDMIVKADAPCETADQFEATLVWMADAEMLPGRTYLLRIGTQTVSRSESTRLNSSHVKNSYAVFCL